MNVAVTYVILWGASLIWAATLMWLVAADVFKPHFKGNSDMDRFHLIEDGAAILSRRGVYRQVKVWRRENEVYAGTSENSFVKLAAGGRTSTAAVSWFGVKGQGVMLAKGRRPMWVE